MAISKATVINILKHDTSYEVGANFFTALNATDGLEADLRGVNDDKFTFLAKNVNATTPKVLTVVKGEWGSQASGDITFNIPANTTIAFALSTAKFKNLVGDNKGKVIFKGDADLQVAVIRLP